MTLNVVLQERQRLFREGLALILAREADVGHIETVADARKLPNVVSGTDTDVVILEVDAGDWSADAVIADLLEVDPDLRIVGIYSSMSLADARRTVEAGAAALSHRAEGVAPILDAIRSTQEVHVRDLAAKSRARTQDPTATSLTARELNVLSLVACGLTTKEMSGRLGISPKTVENHKVHIFSKLNVQSQAHAVSVAMRAGLLSSGDVSEAARGA
jgi:DNA-binding NarL/FixJ family response regulator